MDEGAVLSWPSLTDRDLKAMMALRNQLRAWGFRFTKPWKRKAGCHVLAVDGAVLTVEPMSGGRWLGRVSCNGYDFPPAASVNRGDAAEAAVRAMLAMPRLMVASREPDGDAPDADQGLMSRPF